jgi:predicted ArsR family transcriptional regulator
VADDFAEQVAGVAALADPVRRALYLHVVAQPAAVSRDAAAAGVGVPRHTAKFHLDRLVDDGLLEAEYRRLSGRRGPGAGRPAKLYRRSRRELTVTVPERHYELAAAVLASAVDAALRAERPLAQAVQQAAAEAGRCLAARARAAGSDAGRLESIAGVLAGQGYEPRLHEGTVVLANCPFAALARDHTGLVCGMNLDLIAALLADLGRQDLRATLDPEPGRCCVTVGPAR